TLTSTTTTTRRIRGVWIERPPTPEPEWTIPPSHQEAPKNNWAAALKSTYFQMEECHKLLADEVDDAVLRYNVCQPLPLGGEPGHISIQPDFFFNKDLEYLRYGRKLGISRPALSISKMKAARYPDA
nr:hypothetical protein [Tanacetum cinerariifolium]